jgi:hypothetical protein
VVAVQPEPWLRAVITTATTNRELKEKHNYDLRDFHHPPNINRMIKLTIMRYAGYVTCMAEKR